jgi:hypothetical protein
MLVWALSILVHSLAWRYVMWYFTIVVEAAVLVSFGRRTSVTFAGSHLPERFALFTIIVLGEVSLNASPLGNSYPGMNGSVKNVLGPHHSTRLFALSLVEHHWTGGAECRCKCLDKGIRPFPVSIDEPDLPSSQLSMPP